MNECGCVDVCHRDGEAAQVSERAERRARKEHWCGECGRAISRGERYEYDRALYDGSWSTHRTCSDCLSVRNPFFSCGWEEGGLWVDLQYHIEAHDGEIASECLVPLTPRAREKVCELIEQEWQRQDERDA